VRKTAETLAAEKPEASYSKRLSSLQGQSTHRTGFDRIDEVEPTVGRCLQGRRKRSMSKARFELTTCKRWRDSIPLQLDDFSATGRVCAFVGDPSLFCRAIDSFALVQLVAYHHYQNSSLSSQTGARYFARLKDDVLRLTKSINALNATVRPRFSQCIPVKGGVHSFIHSFIHFGPGEKHSTRGNPMGHSTRVE
jgi:hypothetical protein